ncbi:MAG: protein kinase [Deltaproteobacteria bacterium]|nr:protein kinase [Deltaproteobacteria bacterium]
MPKAGDRLGRYTLSRSLALGQRSEVFLASEGVHAVALKVYQPGAMRAEALAARAALVQGAQHPAVARWLDGGTEGEHAWLALELVDGIPVTALIEAKERIEAPVAAYLAGEVVSALEVLASRGVVHGRLDPSVVLVNKDGRLKILGLDGEPSESDPDFVAPELEPGVQATAKSDVFSVARVMRALFVMAPDRPKSIGELLIRAQGAPANRPSLADLRMGLGVIDRVRGAQAVSSLVTRFSAQKSAPSPKKTQWGEDAGDKTSVDAVDSGALAASLGAPTVDDPSKKKVNWEQGGDTSLDVVDSAALAESLKPQAFDPSVFGSKPAVVSSPRGVSAVPRATSVSQKPIGAPPVAKPTPVPAETDPKKATSAKPAEAAKPADAKPKGPAQWGVAARSPPKVQLTAVASSAPTPPQKLSEESKAKYKPQGAGTGDPEIEFPMWARILTALVVGGGVGTLVYRFLMG